MYCQKCRTLLRLDSSLQDINQAALDLLIGKNDPSPLVPPLTSKAATGKSLPDQSAPARLSYPQERKDLYDRVAASPSSPTYKRSIPAPRHGNSSPLPARTQSGLGSKVNPDMSFIEITQSQVVPPHDLPAEPVQSAGSRPNGTGRVEEGEKDGDNANASLSYDIERNHKLFSILSSHSDIDHPICAECTSLLLSSMNARLHASTRDRDAYISFLKSLQSKNSPIPTIEEVAAAEKSLAETLEEERDALEELQNLEAEKRQTEIVLAELEEQSRALELEEQSFWASRNSFDETMYELSTNVLSLQQKRLHDQQQLHRLQRTNVYNDTFCIGHDGYFGTINGLRLGRLQGHPVEWSEINAAWGQTLLLLATVAERLGYTFQGYRLRPMGSTSRIEKIEWPQQSPDSSSRSAASPTSEGQRQSHVPTTATPKITHLDLFSSGDMPLGRVFFHRRFDAGMVAFLDCLSQMGTFLERTSNISSADTRPSPSRTPSSRGAAAVKRVLPYPIHGEKIGDPATGQAVSIRLGAGFQQDENWTKACKYALTCCKFLLAHVSNMANAKERIV